MSFHPLANPFPALARFKRERNHDADALIARAVQISKVVFGEKQPTQWEGYCLLNQAAEEMLEARPLARAEVGPDGIETFPVPEVAR